MPDNHSEKIPPRRRKSVIVLFYRPMRHKWLYWLAGITFGHVNTLAQDTPTSLTCFNYDIKDGKVSSLSYLYMKHRVPDVRVMIVPDIHTDDTISSAQHAGIIGLIGSKASLKDLIWDFIRGRAMRQNCVTIADRIIQICLRMKFSCKNKFQTPDDLLKEILYGKRFESYRKIVYFRKAEDAKRFSKEC